MNENIQIDQKNSSDLTCCLRPIIYEPYLKQSNLLTIKEFIHELKLPLKIFRVEEYKDAWKNDPNKFMIVDREMLDWLGYEGKYSNQRQNAFKYLKSNFKIKRDFIYDDDSVEVIGNKPTSNEKLLAVSYLCLLQWTMGMSTARGNEIRKQIIAQQMLFELYSEYRSNWQAQKQQLLLESKEEHIEIMNKEISKLKRKNARYEKRHEYYNLEVDGPAYYIFTYGRLCNTGCIMHNFRKHGVAIVDKKGSGPLNRRLKSHRTTLKWLTLELVITAPANCIEVLEKCMEAKFENHLNPHSSEVFENVSLEDLRSAAIWQLNYICPGKYHILSQDKIDAYNRDVDCIIINKDESNENNE